MAEAINQVIDGYWEDKIEEREMIRLLRDILENNDSLIYKNDDFTTILRQRCGKRRLEIVSKIRQSGY